MGGCLCLSQHSSLQAFHRHVVRLSSPSPSSSPLSLVIFQSRCTPPHPLPLTPPQPPPTTTPPPHPAPPLRALSGHPPCLFRWNRRGNESSESAVNHACSACRMQFLLFFSPCRFPALMMACNYIRIYICSVLAQSGGENSLRKGFS